MTRKEAHRLAIYRKGPLGAFAKCPWCSFGAAVRKPYTWGDTEKLKAQVAAHILTNHNTEKDPNT